MPPRTPIHPFIARRIDAMEEAAADELMELKGGAIAYAESQHDSGQVTGSYIQTVSQLVDVAVGLRKRYLKLAPWGVSGLSSVLLASPWMVMTIWNLLTHTVLPGLDDFVMTFLGVSVGLLVSHLTIGVSNSWREMARRKCKWAAIFIAYLGLYGLMSGFDASSNTLLNCGLSVDCLLLDYR